MMYTKYILLFMLSVAACNKSDDPIKPDLQDSMYFPPLANSAWETAYPKDLGWDETALQTLYTFLDDHHTKAFMVLVNGRIVVEKYFNGHTASATWKWNSAGKTLVGSSIGIAQHEGLLSVNDPVSKYLGAGWTSAPNEKENLITIRHLLTMSSGLNEQYEYLTMQNLSYVADAGTRWAYHNVFQLLMDVIDSASDLSFEGYFNSRIRDKIGMEGFWNNGLIFRIYNSNARSMARFGLLALNKGKWENEQIIQEDFFNESIRSSQNLNPAYGFFWWLNGKSSYMVPSGQGVYPGFLVPNAPEGMYAAMGAADQRIYVIPDKKMVIIRLGDDTDIAQPGFAISGFDNIFWEKFNEVIL